ncbi:MAG TPA: GNAT family protein [Chitinophagaceae bacterium]
MEHLTFTPFPELRTSRLLLRQVKNKDAAVMLALRSDDQVMRYIDRPRASNLTEAQQFIQLIHDGITNISGITWAMSLADDRSGKMIGTIGFWRIDKANHRAEIGYMLSPQHFRKGLMNEAMAQVLHYGFNTMQLHSVEANVNPGNQASASLLQKHGFVQEAYFRENYYFNGRFLDSSIYCLLNPNR